MADELGVPSDGGSQESTPAPSAPQGGSSEPTPAPAPIAAPATPAERMLPQSQVDRIVQERVAQERRQAQALISQYDAQVLELRHAQQQGQPQDVTARLQSQVAFIQEQMEENLLDRELERMSNKHADFKGAENDIMLIALENGLGLDKAYQLWKYDHVSQINVEDLRQQAIDDYVAGKLKSRAKTPTPAGPGGQAPVHREAHDGSPETAHKRAMARALAAE